MISLINKIIPWVRNNRRRITVWTIALITGFMIFKGFMQMPQIRESKLEIAKVKEQIEYEKTRQQETDELSEQVDSDEYIEKVASEKLGLVKSNAKIFVDVSQEK